MTQGGLVRTVVPPTPPPAPGCAGPCGQPPPQCAASCIRQSYRLLKDKQRSRLSQHDTLSVQDTVENHSADQEPQ